MVARGRRRCRLCGGSRARERVRGEPGMPPTTTRQTWQPCGRPTRRSSVLLPLVSQHHYTGLVFSTGIDKGATENVLVPATLSSRVVSVAGWQMYVRGRFIV